MFPHPHVADSASFASGALLQLTDRQEDEIVRRAIEILERRVFHSGLFLDRPAAVADYLRLQLATEPGEVFAVVFLDGMNRAIAFEPLFRGSVNQAAVYPRVVAQRALLCNAAGVILAHSHPSGVTKPSLADRELTLTLVKVLSILDIKVLDHFIIGQGWPYSFSQNGLL
jgi:DNA repair protein RadC